jgi:hypothetical protein
MDLIPKDPIKQLIGAILFLLIILGFGYWIYRCRLQVEEEEDHLLYNYAYTVDINGNYVKIRRPKTFYNSSLNISGNEAISY